MENSSELLTRRNPNILNLRKISTLDSTSSSFKPKKLKLRNEISSLLKFNDNTIPKKLDFPMCFSLFTLKKTNENQENSKRKEKNNSKLNLNLNLKSIKPKHLNNLNLNDIIKTNNKKIISRNKNYFNSPSHSHLKSKNNNPSFTRFISPNKTNASQLLLNKLNYSPPNILSNKNPIIINQIGLSSPILKLNTKFNNSNSTIEQDISIIKNIKGLSINNLNYNINFSDKKIMPSIFSSPTSFDSLFRMHKNQKNNKKKKIFQMKKKVQNDINNFENKIDKITINNETKEENKTINSFNFENGNNTIDKSEINDEKNNAGNKIQISEKKIQNNINNKTFYKSSKKLLEEKNLKDGINPIEKYSSIQSLYRLEYKLNNHFDNQTHTSLKGNKIENKNENKIENEKESSKKTENINLPENNSTKDNINNINNNKSKLARLSRLKKSSLKTGVKQKKRVSINDTKENKTKKEEKINNKENKDIKDNKDINHKKINIENKIDNKNNENKNDKNNLKNNDKKGDDNDKVSLNKEKKKIFLKTKTNFEKRKSLTLEDKISLERDKIKRSKSSRVVESKKLNILKIKKNKFYLTINKKRTNNVYDKNKFLKKWNDKLNEIKSNNRIYRQIYVQKTKMLLNTQEKTEDIISNEKIYLDFPENTNTQNINIYYDGLIVNNNKIRKKDENTINTFKMKHKFKCNLCPCIYDSIISIIDFDSFPENITSIKHKKKTNNFIFNRQRRISRKNFQTVKLRRLSLFDFDDNENGDNFSLTKTKNNILKELEWMYIPINLLSIQEIILRSNDYYYDKQLRLYGRKRRSTIRKVSHSYIRNEKGISESRETVRQLSLSKKFSNLNYSQLKKNMKRNDFSILNQKKFFKRQRTKVKRRGSVIYSKRDFKSFNEDNSSEDYYSDRLSSLEKSANLEEVYFELMSLILEGKNKQFLKQFEKHKNIININQQLIGGNTLLILCAREGNFAIAKFLCDQRIEVNIQNNGGNTALHYAIGNQFYSIADVLTRHGAREDIANNKGLLPWDCVENNID